MSVQVKRLLGCITMMLPELMRKPNGLQHNDSTTREFILMNFEAVVIFLFIVAMIIAGFLNQAEKQEASNIFAFIGLVMLIIFGFLTIWK